MASIKERAAALNLAEKLRVRPQGLCVPGKPQSSSLWSGLISHLRSSVTVKRRWLHLKSHSDCFLGCEAVDVVTEHMSGVKGFQDADVSRDKVVCVCQALLDCKVFEAVGTKVFGKDRKQEVFQDSKSALYRFVTVRVPSVDELERGFLADVIQRLFCRDQSERQDERTCPTETHVSISTPVKVIQMSTNVPVSLSVEAVDSQWMSVSPSRIQSHSAVPQSVVDEVWHEQTLLRLLNLVEVPLLEGLLHCSKVQSSPRHRPPHNNPDLIYSSNHLDRQILKAFRDAQEDQWLRAALDCLDFLSDQPVVELSRELPRCFPQDPESCEQAAGGGGGAEDGGKTSNHGGASEEPGLSVSGLDQWKLLLYRTVSRHYGHTDRSPLMPQNMSDVYTAITELLVNAKFDKALEALQLCLKLLPPGCRDELRRLLTFMSLAADPQGIKLDKEMENRLAVKRAFSRAVVHSRVLPKDKEDLLVVFMLSNIKEIFKIPGALHKGVSDKLAGLVQETQPDVTGPVTCQQVSSRTYTDSTKENTRQELWALLNSIHLNTKVSAKERKRRLGQFSQAHPEIFNQYFGDSALSVL